MEAPKCKLCATRHWSTQPHGGDLAPTPPRPTTWFVPKKGRRYSVYGLIDPRDGKVFYVGCTYDLPQRLRAHRGCPQTSPVYPIKMALRQAGLKIDHCVFGEYDGDVEARWYEREWITRLLPQLVNSHDPICHGTLSYVLFPPEIGDPKLAQAEHEAFLAQYYGAAAMSAELA